MPEKEPKEAPRLPPKQIVEFSLGIFFPILSAVSKAMSEDETRPHLNGVCIRVKGKYFTMTATDGHMLATYTGNQEQPDPDSEAKPWKPDEILLTASCVEHLIQEMKWIKRKRGKLRFPHERIVINHREQTCELMVGTLNLETSDEGFPPMRGVFQRKKKLPKKRLSVLGIDPKILKKASTIFEVGADAVGLKAGALVMQSIGDDISAPVLVTSPSLPQMRCLLMGMRLDDSEYVPVDVAADPNMIDLADLRD